MGELRQLNARKVQVSVEHLLDQVGLQFFEIAAWKILNDADRFIPVALQSMINVRNYRTIPPCFHGLRR